MVSEWRAARRAAGAARCGIATDMRMRPDDGATTRAVIDTRDIQVVAFMATSNTCCVNLCVVQAESLHQHAA